MEQRTHQRIDPDWVGKVVRWADDRAVVELTLRPEMAADERGLVHGGFVFGLADYAAMLAVNEPTVVLADSRFRFLAPCVVGQRLTAIADRVESEGKRWTVHVVVDRDDVRIAEGEFHCVVPSRHVLDRHG